MDMEIKVYNQKGEELKDIKLPKEIFEVTLNHDLLHQMIVAMQENKRQGTAHTKTRGEVSGSRKKPWPQKGTGRARHGDRYSPLWRGGGIAFGPRKDKKYGQKLQKKMRRKALFMALSEKARDGSLIILNKIELSEPKTKLMHQVVSNLREKIETIDQGRILVALPGKEENVIRATKNLPDVHTIEARNLNVLELLSFKNLILHEKSIEIIKEVFVNANTK